MEITRRARGTELQRHQQRVFLCWCPDNAKERDKLAEDLLSHDAGADCVVSWLEDPAGDIDETLLRQELRETQLFVFLVTLPFLKQNRDEDAAEFRIAKELGDLPKLPVATDAGLFPMLTEQEHAVHGIAMDDFEYRTKLRAQLDNFIASDELIKEITEKAFTGRLFLSYRKVDIDHARAFMKAFHDVPGFESIAIWYDNFLTAGRVFDEEIRQSIDAADVFVLLVTPNLLKPNAAGRTNYVLAEELPYAVRTGKKIVAVEAVPTDRAAFAAACPGAGDCISLDELDGFEDYLPEGAVLEEMDERRSWLLGEAFLRGMMVEADFGRAVRLLENATGVTGIYDTVSARAASSASFALAVIYGEGGYLPGIQYSEALRWWQRVVAISEKTWGAEHPDTARIYNGISELYEKMGQYAKAMEMSVKGLAIREQTLGAEHPDTARSYDNTGALYMKVGMHEKALEMYRKALAIRQKMLGAEHLNTGYSYNSIGVLYIRMGEYDKALEMFMKTLGILEKVLGTGHLNTVSLYNNMGGVYWEMGKHEKALEILKKTLAAREMVLGTDHPDTAQSYSNIGSVYHDMGEHKKALEMDLKALAIRERVLGVNHPDTALSCNNIGTAYNSIGNDEKALEMFKKALVIREKVLGAKHPDTAQSYNNIGAHYEGMREYGKALEMHEKALAIREKVLGPGHPLTKKSERSVIMVRQLLARQSRSIFSKHRKKK